MSEREQHSHYVTRERRKIELLIFDLGDTLISQVVDRDAPLPEHALRLLPGTGEALRELAKRYRLAILSNTEQTTGEQLNIVLRQLALADLPIKAFASVSLGVRKPDPEAFRRVLDVFGVTPDRAVMIGNDIREDIGGGRAAGLFTICVGRTASVAHSGADVSLPSVADLTPEIVESLAARQR